jgi:ketosteroid isomerase-like protein
MDPDMERRIRGGYEAFVRGDLEATLNEFAAEPSFVNPDYALEGGEVKGLEEVAAAFLSVHDWMRVDSIEVEEIVEGPDGYLVMVRVRGEGRASGAPVDAGYAHVLEYSGDRVHRFTWFETREEGLAAIGLG